MVGRAYLVDDPLAAATRKEFWAASRPIPASCCSPWSNEKLRAALEDGCRKLSVVCISVLDPVLAALGGFLHAEGRASCRGRQHALDAEYFARIEAMDFVMAHDDGQLLDGLVTGGRGAGRRVALIENADLPCSCNRGIKAANVPLVPGRADPARGSRRWTTIPDRGLDQ